MSTSGFLFCRKRDLEAFNGPQDQSFASAGDDLHPSYEHCAAPASPYIDLSSTAG